jgi:sortase A
MTVVREEPEEVQAPQPPKRSLLRRALHTLSSVLIVSGTLLLVDAGLTVLWQEPLSAIYARVQQDKLSGQLDKLTVELQEPTPLERRALAALPDDKARFAFRARALDRRAKDGQPIGRIKIPRIGLSKVIVEGTRTGDLQKGPGHYPKQPFPGAPGTVAIAGHRTTYGAPFRKIDKLKGGDQITLQMPYGTFTYRVERTRIVAPTALWVTQRVSYNRLVLTACHPLYSAAKRIVVFARLVGEQARGGAL